MYDLATVDKFLDHYIDKFAHIYKLGLLCHKKGYAVWNQNSQLSNSSSSYINLSFNIIFFQIGFERW